MDILGPALNGAFVLVMTLVVTWYIRDRFCEQDTKLLELRHDMDRRFAELKADMDRRFLEVKTEMAGIHAEIVAIALAVGARPRPDTA